MARKNNKRFTVRETITALSISTILMYFIYTWYFPMAFNHVLEGLKSWPGK